MARIATYSKDTSISNNDLLVGTDADDSNITKNYKIEDLASFVKGYKDYVFSFSQSGTNDPVVTEMTNSTGLTFTFTRVTPGVFYLVPSSNIDINKLWVQTTGSSVETGTVLSVKGINTNRIDIVNLDFGVSPEDGINVAFVEVRIYP